MTIGQTWEGCLAAEPIQCLLTLKQRMDHYTNSGGTTYSDVLQVYVTFFYSAGDTIRDYYGKKTTGTANLYFARGIGLVEGNLINYEHLNFNGYNGKLWSFVHEIATGTVWRKN
jgi:hypothetical protein